MEFSPIISPYLSVAGITLLAAWMGSFFSLRKDEKSVQIAQITGERTKWRAQIREISNEIVRAITDEKNNNKTPEIASFRNSLVTLLNPKDHFDIEIIDFLDKLIDGSETNINDFSLRISLLLKHDWERVKSECTPVYLKPWQILFGKNAWKQADYRATPIKNCEPDKKPESINDPNFLEQFINVKKTDITLKFFFDHLRNYTIAAAILVAGIYLLKNGSSISIAPYIGNITGSTLILIGIISYALNFAQGIFAYLNLSPSNFFYAVVSTLILLTSIDLFATAILSGIGK
ncbi:hypothetical protein BOW65_18450 [Pseudomonas koreensis]|jgi:hypothetical protein|uniref:hypothetical protein n=1 Tax=Pseudomonas koreensis TaxID=198620 RepID=UPI000986B74A|nr:hypothetical protein [Pseudomonas koreensis]OOH78698.1 hypothetical protein BOW65_18450 [Pseudomonas koreensis]